MPNVLREVDNAAIYIICAFVEKVGEMPKRAVLGLGNTILKRFVKKFKEI